MDKIKKIRIASGGVLALVIFIFLFLGVVPTGHINYSLDYTDTKKSNYFIGRPTPAERIGTSSGNLIITGEPIYLSLSTPRRFNQAAVKIRYKNPDNLPLIETGIMVDKITKQYDLQPIENRTIEQLLYVWDKSQEDGLILLQKEKKYNNIDSFLSDLPPRKEIGVYNYDLPGQFVIGDYKPSPGERKITHPLRGTYQFYTYVKNEKLDFSFEVTDLNLNKDTDGITIDLYHNGRVVESRRLDDDGIIDDIGRKSPDMGIKISLSDLPEGVYKINFKCNDDIVTQSIVTSQSKIAFINRLWLYEDNLPRQSALRTNSSLIYSQTSNPASLQKILVNGKELEINETYRQFSQAVDSVLSKIVMEKSDIVISGNGLFSFDDGMFFNPEMTRITGNINPESAGIKYIIARYQPLASIDGWRETSAILNLENTYRESRRHLWGDPGKYSMIISVPGLRADDGNDEQIEIDRIDISLAGTSLVDKVKKIYQNIQKNDK